MGNVDKWIEQGIIDKDISTYNNISLPYKETEKYLKKLWTHIICIRFYINN